jgi:hypothetical protein
VLEVGCGPGRLRIRKILIVPHHGHAPQRSGARPRRRPGCRRRRHHLP